MHIFLNYAQEIFNFFRSLITGVLDPAATVTGVVIAMLVPLLSIVLKELNESRGRAETNKRQIEDYVAKKMAAMEQERKEIFNSVKSKEEITNEERKRKIWAKHYPGLLEREDRRIKELRKKNKEPENKKVKAINWPYYLLTGITVLMGVFLLIILIRRLTQ